jgi:hypothetical protein
VFDKVQVVKLYELIITFYFERSCLSNDTGKRSGVEKIPYDKPHKSEQMITIMQRCWDQDPRERPTSQVTLHLIADLFVL